MDIRELKGDEIAEWDAFAAAHPDGNIFHASRYARILEEWGHDFEIVAARSGGTFAAGAVIDSRPLPMTAWRSGNAEGGVLLARNDAGLLREFAAGLIAALSAKSYVDFRLYLHQPRRIDGREVAENLPLHDAVDGLGFRRDDNEIGTYFVRLDRDDEALVDSYSKNCRRDVRKAEREGVTVEASDDEGLLELFYEQHASTYGRKGLQVPLKKPFVATYARGIREKIMRIYSARFAGKIVNMAIVSLVGVPRYMKGASIVSTLDERVPPSGQILHFEIMRRLRDEGYRLYDLGGSPGLEPIESHPNYSVWRFKRGFGGEFRQDLGEYHLVLDKMKHKVLSLAKGVHGKLGSLRAVLDG
jgi:hypothetical protein